MSQIPGWPEHYTEHDRTSTYGVTIPRVSIVCITQGHGEGKNLVLASRINNDCYHCQCYLGAEPAFSLLCSLTPTYTHRNVLSGPVVWATAEVCLHRRLVETST